MLMPFPVVWSQTASCRLLSTRVSAWYLGGCCRIDPPHTVSSNIQVSLHRGSFLSASYTFVDIALRPRRGIEGAVHPFCTQITSPGRKTRRSCRQYLEISHFIAFTFVEVLNNTLVLLECSIEHSTWLVTKRSGRKRAPQRQSWLEHMYVVLCRLASPIH